MGRQALRITVLLGLLISLLGSTGIFAVFTDRATAGTDSVTSGVRPRAADIRIEVAGFSAETGVDCEVDGDGNGEIFSDDTTSAQFTVSNAQPGQPIDDAYVCLKNVGSASLAITSSAIDLVDLDIDCTGDESVAGDTTCGPDANEVAQAGELSALLTVEMERVVCSDPSMPYANRGQVALDLFSAQEIELSLAPDQVACIRIQLRYPTVDEAVAQVAQSDRATWRFVFDATAM